MSEHDQHDQDAIDERRAGLPQHLDWLDLATLGQARDGMVARMFAAAAQIVANDLQNAPDIGTARTITIVVTCKPLGVDDTGNLQGIAAGVAVKHSVPKRTAAIALEARPRLLNGRQHGRGLALNVDNADRPAQRNFPNMTNRPPTNG